MGSSGPRPITVACVVEASVVLETEPELILRLRTGQPFCPPFKPPLMSKCTHLESVIIKIKREISQRCLSHVCSIPGDWPAHRLSFTATGQSPASRRRVIGYLSPLESQVLTECSGGRCFFGGGGEGGYISTPWREGESIAFGRRDEKQAV